MRLCQEIGEWIKDHIREPLEQFFNTAQEVCNEVSEWVEHTITEPITRYRNELEQHCREETCIKWCFCCNKWFCWFVTIVVSFIEWVAKIVGEWLVKVICDIIITIVRTIVMVLVEILIWIVLFVICFLEALCPILLLVGAVALLVLLLAIAVQGIPALAAWAAWAIPIATATAATALGMVWLLCRIDKCRIVNAIAWALRWAIVLGAIIALIYLSAMTAWVVTIYGGLMAALVIFLERGRCKLKSMRELP